MSIMIESAAIIPVVELIRFTPKEPYLSNPGEAVEEFAGILTDVDGCISVFHGLELEKSEPGKERGMIFILWRTIEHHRALQSDTDRYPTLRSAIRNVAEDISMFHVIPKRDPTPSFTADAVEISLMKFKTGHSGSDNDIAGPLDDLMAYEAPEHVGKPTWGQVHEEKEKVVLFVGWESVEAHNQIRNQVVVQEMAQKVFGRIDEYLEGAETRHVKVNKYSPKLA